jgi:hypothetical protein
VAGQLVVAALAARALYKTTALFILWPESQQFNTYLLTESLFLNLSVLVGLLLCALVRPNGFIVGLAIALVGLLTLAWRPQKGGFWLVLAGLAALGPVLWRLLNYQLAPYTLIETY